MKMFQPDPDLNIKFISLMYFIGCIICVTLWFICYFFQAESLEGIK